MKPRSCGKTLLMALGCLVWFAIVAFLSFHSDGPSLFRTLVLGISAACIAIPFGVSLNWMMQHAGWLGRLATMSTIMLLFFPLFLHVSLWDAAFGKLGWLTSTRGEVLKPIVTGWTAAIWIHGIAAAPQVALIYWLGSLTGTAAHEEQASLDASPLSVLLHVKLMRAASLSLLAMAWVVVACSREIAVTDIYQIGTLAEQVYLGYSMGAIGSVAGTWSTRQLMIATEFQIGPSLIPIGCFCLLFSVGFIRLAAAGNDEDTGRPSHRKDPSRTSLVLGIATLFLLVVIPFANALYRSGFSVRPVEGEPVGGFKISQLWDVLERAITDFRGEFFWSLMIASVASTIIVLLATVLAWSATRNRLFRWGFIILLAISLALPGPLIGTGIADLFSNVKLPPLIWLYDRTIFAPVLASLLFCWPLAGLLFWFLFSRTDRQALLNIQVDGGTAWIAFWQLGILRNASALGGAWLLIFALSFGELSASQLVLPPGMDTLPRLMLGLLHAGVDEMTAAIALVVAATIVAVSMIAYCLMTKRVTCTNGHQ